MDNIVNNLYNIYQQLLENNPEKWVNAAGEVCFMFSDNGLTICAYFDSNNIPCISLYSVQGGSIKNEIIIRQNSHPEDYNSFIGLYNRIKEQSDKNKFIAIQNDIQSNSEGLTFLNHH